MKASQTTHYPFHPAWSNPGQKKAWRGPRTIPGGIKKVRMTHQHTGVVHTRGASSVLVALREKQGHSLVSGHPTSRSAVRIESGNPEPPWLPILRRKTRHQPGYRW
jgi:hypothetical protein